MNLCRHKSGTSLLTKKERLYDMTGHFSKRNIHYGTKNILFPDYILIQGPVHPIRNISLLRAIGTTIWKFSILRRGALNLKSICRALPYHKEISVS